MNLVQSMMPLELENKIQVAGDRYAIEWAKLERLGFDAAKINAMSGDQCDEACLPFIRARDHFLTIIQLQEAAGRSIPFRYRMFLAGGCSHNPGIVVPTVGILALVLLLACTVMIVIDGSETTMWQIQVISGLCILVALSWDKLWNSLVFASVRLGF